MGKLILVEEQPGEIIISKNAKEPENKAAKILQEKIRGKSNLNLKIRKENKSETFDSKDKLFILLGSIQSPFPLIDRLTQKINFNKNILKEEDFAIKYVKESGNHYILVIGGSPLSVIFGVGKLLRNMNFSQNALQIPEINLIEKPVHKIRGTFIATHHPSRCYHEWDFDMWQNYVTELALWGINTIFYFPLQYGQWNRKVWYGTESEKAKWDLLGSRVPLMIKSLGLKVGVHINFNDVFPEDAVRMKPPKNGTSEDIAILVTEAGGGMICPSPAKNQKIIIDLREELFQKLPHIDLLSIDITDDGGCACSDCKKGYVGLYLKLSKEISKRLKKYHPKADVIINTQALSKKGIDSFCRKIRKDSNWVDYILYDCFGVTLALEDLRAKLPDKFKDRILAQPEITMRDGMGKRGAVPWVKEFDHAYEKSYDLVAIGGWDMQRNKYWHPEGCYLMLPNNLPRACSVEELNGALSYSEGLHDDITKIIWAQKGWRPKKAPVGILNEYCGWYFGEKTRDRMVKAILKMERISILRPRVKTAEISKLVSEVSGLVESSEKEISARAKEDWRWKLLLLRAKTEELLTCGSKDGKLREDVIRLQKTIHGLTGTRFAPEELPVGKETLEYILEQDHNLYDLRMSIFERIEKW